MNKPIFIIPAVFALIYLLFSFVMWQFPLRFSEWDPITRYFYAVLHIFLVPLITYLRSEST